jgi:hypothetical protein
MHRLTWVIALLLLALTPFPTAQAATITLPASQDNDLLENLDGLVSGGASPFIYVGRLGSSGSGLKRRGAVAFNLSTIPANATITAASLTMNLARGNGGSTPIELHRFTKAWGQGASSGGPQGGPSTPNDVTWIHSFYSTSFWSTPGGDFAPAVSSVQNADFSGAVIWPSTPQLVADVQGWVANPASNFGLILIGDESNLATAKEFNSRENNNGPLLTVNFTVPEPATLTLLVAGVTFLARRSRRPVAH